eukprot:gene21024-27891_t
MARQVDVEGFEWAVMAGAMKLLTNYNVANIAMEYSPGATERSLNHTMNIATPQMLVDILSSGYRIGHMENKMKSAGWEGPATPIEEVLLGNVKYDVEDAQRRRDGTLGCPLPESIKKEFYPCGSIPEDQNPRDKAACGDLETRVAKLASLGNIPSSYVLP